MTLPQASYAFVGNPVDLRHVERELSQQLRGMTSEERAPVQRVRMSNLVVFCGTVEQADAVAVEVPDVVAVHPARVFLLLEDPQAPPGVVTAGVNVTCRLLSKHVQACSELISLRAPTGLADRLPFAVRALLIGDLPTTLWWASTVPPPLAGPLLHDLADNAQQIMYDSIGWPQPALGVAATASWLEQIERTEAGRWRVASDLNWRRLKYWRRLATQALDPASAPGVAESVTEILIEHGPHAVVQAWELASWLSLRLNWSVQGGQAQLGVEICWRFRGPKGEVQVRVKRRETGPPEIARVRLTCTFDGKPGAINLTRDSDQRLAITLEGVEAEPRTVTLPGHASAELIGRQLSDRERDPVFRQSMVIAQVMARSLLG
jgi:glucose-6-phosphate dehydrogenase assembly protein OpcA